MKFEKEIIIILIARFIFMKIVYHHRYTEVYASDPAAMPGRMERIYEELKKRGYEFVEPDPASEEDLLLAHSIDLLEDVRRETAYEISALAAGGAIMCAELALSGEPAFGLIRPPGHHAGRNFNGGFCRFNNLAVAIEKLLAGDKINRPLIVDIDLHYGNGTEDIFRGRDILFLNMKLEGREEFLSTLRESLSGFKYYDIIAVSAGFDTYEFDWGGTLKTEDYVAIGKMIKRASMACDGRRFAVLEGGYYLPDLGKNVAAFLEGFR